MRYLGKCSLQLSFKVLCFIATVSIIIYWIIRFLKNEDISSIQIKSIDEEIEDFTQLEITLCLANPFYEHILQKVNQGMSKNGYLRYLRGAEKDAAIYSELEFDNVTISVPDQLESVHVHWRLVNDQEVSICDDLYACPYATFQESIHGFLRRGTFVKCSKIDLNEKYAKEVDKITLRFKSSVTNYINEYEDIYIYFNYPNQQLLSRQGELIFHDLIKAIEYPILTITSVEIFKRRNKWSMPCLSSRTRYDEYILDQHINKVGCRAPYQQTSNKNTSICATPKKMERSIFQWPISESKYGTPCQSISTMDYKMRHLPKNSDKENSSYVDKEALMFTISFPDKIKFITQSQKINSESLIGYIGGYVGLFLGRYIYFVEIKFNSNQQYHLHFILAIE